MKVFDFLRRYDRLWVLIFGAVMTFLTVYSKFNKMMEDVQANRANNSFIMERMEKYDIFVEKQTLIDQRQNEILNDLKDQLRHTWRGK